MALQGLCLNDFCLELYFKGNHLAEYKFPKWRVTITKVTELAIPVVNTLPYYQGIQIFKFKFLLWQFPDKELVFCFL